MKSKIENWKLALASLAILTAAVALPQRAAATGPLFQGVTLFTNGISNATNQQNQATNRIVTAPSATPNYIPINPTNGSLQFELLLNTTNNGTSNCVVGFNTSTTLTNWTTTPAFYITNAAGGSNATTVTNGTITNLLGVQGVRADYLATSQTNNVIFTVNISQIRP